MAVTAHEISWKQSFDEALREAAQKSTHVLVDFSAAPMWAGCARLDAEVYADPSVADFVMEHFHPVRVHVRDNAGAFKELGQRFGAQWTPTVLIVDSDGKERHRIEGFLPTDDFLAQLKLGLAQSAFARGDFAEAERLFRQVTEQHAKTDAGPEALYWAGVSRYKATNDAVALTETARAFGDRYTDTSWAKKASVWKG